MAVAHMLQGRRLSPWAAPSLVWAPAPQAQPHSDGSELARRAPPGTLKATATHFAAVPVFPLIIRVSSITSVLFQEGFEMLCVRSQFWAYQARSIRDREVSTAPAKLHAFPPAPCIQPRASQPQPGREQLFVPGQDWTLHNPATVGKATTSLPEVTTP